MPTANTRRTGSPSRAMCASTAEHLRSTWPHRHDPWESLRTQYIQSRFDDETSGQIGFYERALIVDSRRLRRCRETFNVFSVLAIIATIAELGLLLFSPASHKNGLTSGQSYLVYSPLCYPCWQWAGCRGRPRLTAKLATKPSVTRVTF